MEASPDSAPDRADREQPDRICLGGPPRMDDPDQASAQVAWQHLALDSLGLLLFGLASVLLWLAFVEVPVGGAPGRPALFGALLCGALGLAWRLGRT